MFVPMYVPMYVCKDMRIYEGCDNKILSECVYVCMYAFILFAYEFLMYRMYIARLGIK